eukprot:9157306-Pyramimonas_sp.AAC.1
MPTLDLRGVRVAHHHEKRQERFKFLRTQVELAQNLLRERVQQTFGQPLHLSRDRGVVHNEEQQERRPPVHGGQCPVVLRSSLARQPEPQTPPVLSDAVIGHRRPEEPLGCHQLMVAIGEVRI